MTLPPYELLDTRRVCFVAMNPMRPTRCRQHVFCCLIHPPDATKGCLVACMSSSHKGNTNLYFWAAILKPMQATKHPLISCRSLRWLELTPRQPGSLGSGCQNDAGSQTYRYFVCHLPDLLSNLRHNPYHYSDSWVIYCKTVFIMFREFNYIQL